MQDVELQGKKKIMPGKKSKRDKKEKKREKVKKKEIDRRERQYLSWYTHYCFNIVSYDI